MMDSCKFKSGQTNKSLESSGKKLLADTEQPFLNNCAKWKWFIFGS